MKRKKIRKQILKRLENLYVSLSFPICLLLFLFFPAAFQTTQPWLGSKGLNAEQGSDRNSRSQAGTEVESAGGRQGGKCEQNMKHTIPGRNKRD